MFETFNPVEIREYYIKRIAGGMSRYFADVLFNPIFDILKGKTVNNARPDLLEAIKSGRVYYKDGAFRTDSRFNNLISTELEKIGAVFRNGAYYLNNSLIPTDILQALDMAKVLTSAKLYAVQQFLNSFNVKDVDLKPYIKDAVVEMFGTLERDILKEAQTKKVPVIELGIVKPDIENIPKDTVKDIKDFWAKHEKKAKDLRKKINEAEKAGKDTTELEKQFTKLSQQAFDTAPKFKIDDAELNAQSTAIAEDYIYNMQYWVKNWETKDIITMRKDIVDMVQKGVRQPEIEKYFIDRWQHKYKVKAEFLAKNESHLAGSVITKTQFKKLGATQFLWVRSSSKEKRELHKLYYNKVFDLDNPPIIDEKLGIKGLPRQIWNCLCHMRIVVPSFASIQRQAKENRQNKTIIGKIKNAVNSTKRNNNIGRYRRFDERAAL